MRHAADPDCDDALAEAFELDFLRQLLDDIHANRIILPSLPEVAIRVRKTADDPRATASRVAAAISADSAMSGRLLKVANSAAYRRLGGHIESVRAAVVRLGIPLVRTLVTNLAIVQIMRAPSAAVGKHLRVVFEHSVAVATMAYALSMRLRKGNPDRIMLAGMVHDIGYQPILQKAGSDRRLLADEARIQQLSFKLHPEVGAKVLELWGFGADFIEAARQHEDHYRINIHDPDLLDFLIVADLSVEHPLSDRLRSVDKSRVYAFHKLGLSPDDPIAQDEQTLVLMEQAKQALLL